MVAVTSHASPAVKVEESGDGDYQHEDCQHHDYQHDEYQHQDYQHEDVEMDNAEPDGFGPPENFPYISFDTLFPLPPFALGDDGVKQQQYHRDDLLDQLPIDPQLLDLDLHNAPLHHHHNNRHHHHLNNALDPQLETLFPNGILEQEDASCPILASLSNNMLLSIVRTWQDLIHDGEIEDALSQPLFLELMGELVERGVVGTDWRWKIDVRDVDPGFVRVVA